MQIALRFFILLFFLPVSNLVLSQSIKGRITGPSDTPVPLAVIYDETSLTGTTSNSDGYYELKLETGKHTVLFKAMGYFQVREEIVLANASVTRNIQLREQAVQVKEVIIRPGKEDPAYAIMRKAIRQAPFHLKQVSHYTADVYLRGTLHIIKIPKFISKRIQIEEEGLSIKSGDVFLEESINRIEFKSPDIYDQKVISIRSTFPDDGADVNPMQLIKSSLYEPKIMGEFISPFAPNAFNFYKFKYEGFFEENGRSIFKITVVPKQNSQQLVRGSLYIVDQLFCLHSADLSIHMFFGNLNYRTVYSPVKPDVWLAVSHQFFVDAGIIGVKATYKYASSVKFSDVKVDDKLMVSYKPAIIAEESGPSVSVPKKQSKTEKDINELLTKEDLTNRDVIKLSRLMAKSDTTDSGKEQNSLEIKDAPDNQTVTVEDNAIKDDTAYWNEMRPIPLSSIEATIPRVKSGSNIKSQPDTLTLTIGARKTSTENPAFRKFTDFLMKGKGFSLFDSNLKIHYNGLLGLDKFDFNTVDGFIFRQSFNIVQKVGEKSKIDIRPGASWAFSRKRFMWWTNIDFEYAPLRLGNIGLYVSSQSTDYNDETGLNSTINSLASLIFRRNYLKLYQHNIIYLHNRIDLANGLNLNAKAGYRTSMPLQNHSDFSFFYRDTREYSPNIPGDSADVLAVNIYNEAAFFDIRLEFTPRYHYRIRNGKKEYEYSKYPTFFIRNLTSIPGIFNSTADYSYIETGLNQTISWEMMHEFSWKVQAGFFVNRNTVYAMDKKYFDNQNLPVNFSRSAQGSFRLLPFYEYAIDDQFAEAHVEYSTPYLMLKYLPFISHKLWVERLYLNYLARTAGRHYFEAGYGIGNIFLLANIGVFAGFENGSFKAWGVQAWLNL